MAWGYNCFTFLPPCTKVKVKVVDTKWPRGLFPSFVPFCFCFVMFLTVLFFVFKRSSLTLYWTRFIFRYFVEISWDPDTDEMHLYLNDIDHATTSSPGNNNSDGTEPPCPQEKRWKRATSAVPADPTQFLTEWRRFGFILFPHPSFLPASLLFFHPSFFLSSLPSFLPSFLPPLLPFFLHSFFLPSFHHSFLLPSFPTFPSFPRFRDINTSFLLPPFLHFFLPSLLQLLPEACRE